ncbi:AMP-binding protein [bacterium]|nr:AMP-binding protein [bacterium]
MKNRDTNVLSLLEDKTNIYARKTALGMKTNIGWKELTYDGLGLMARRLASYLINDLGIQKEEKMAILSESKPEFGVCVLGSVISGMITVPLDIKLTIYELTSILTDCQPSVMLVSQNYIDKALELQKAVPSLKHIIVMDEQPVSNGLQSLYTIPHNYNCKWRHRSRNSRMFIIYTSGTTGNPKGVETTFGNILAQLKDLKIVMSPIFPKKDTRILSILPMNHLFEMTVGFATFLNMGFSVYYTQSLKPKDCLNMIKDRKINFMISVPAFLRLMKTTLEAEMRNAPKFYQTLFKFNFHYVAKFLPFRWVKKILFRRLHNCFGGHFRSFMSGGAPYDFETAKFFRRIGIEVYEGYGLTETSPVASFNSKWNRDLRSVGELLPGFEGKIDPETGELLLRGPSIMKGYHNQPELTAEAIDKDGWFHTGDKARLEGRNIYITGRIKNMIVLSGGKKVFPEEVEAVLEKSDKFAELCVFGMEREGGAKDGTEDIALVIVPSEQVKAEFSGAELEKVIKDEVRRLSKQLAPYKRPINITITDIGLPRTATRKIQRRKVKELVQSL